MDRELIRSLKLPWLSLASAIAAWLLWMTLRSNPTVAAGLAPLTAPATARGISPRWLIGLAGNIVVFVPLGFTFALSLQTHPIRRRLVLSTCGGAALSLIIELAQMARPSRVSSLEDWILNTGGTAIGALTAYLIVRWTPRIQPLPQRLTFDGGNLNDRPKHSPGTTTTHRTTCPRTEHHYPHLRPDEGPEADSRRNQTSTQ